MELNGNLIVPRWIRGVVGSEVVVSEVTCIVGKQPACCDCVDALSMATHCKRCINAYFNVLYIVIINGYGIISQICEENHWKRCLTLSSWNYFLICLVHVQSNLYITVS